VKPLLDLPGVSSSESLEKKGHFLRDASALSSPLLARPFGLVMIEAMACGTPCSLSSGVPCGSRHDGVTGQVVTTFEAVAVLPVVNLDRQK
jgi:glycosyltransferase involved in cell wall biosynthesis